MDVQGRLGGPYLLTTGPHRGAAGCGAARGTLRGEGAQRRVRAPRRPRMGSVCAEERAPSPPLRVRVSAGGRCPRSLRGGVCVCARGDRARLEPPPQPPPPPSVTARAPERGAPRLPSPAPHRAPLGQLCPAGEAPPPPRSQAWGGREGTDHRLRRALRRVRGGCRPMGARGRG